MLRRIAGFALTRDDLPSTVPRGIARSRSIVDALAASNFVRTPSSSWR
jgi:hypothetical protein